MRLTLLSVLCYAAGIASVALYPRFAQRTYVSENALLPGHAWVSFAASDSAAASTVAAELRQQQQQPSWQIVAARMAAAGMDPRVHGNGTAVAGVLRAPRGDGREALALAARLSSPESVGLLLAVAAHLSAQNWLAKDVVVVAAASGPALGAWLDDYVARGARAGALQAAVCLDVPGAIGRAARFRDVNVRLHGANGQLPNLDMLNVVVRIAAKTGFPGRIALDPSSASPLLAMLPPAQRELAGFMARQAAGLPTGDHAYFTRYRIDAITLTASVPVVAAAGAAAAVGQAEFGVLVVGLLRSLNNLLEHLHQSFYFYILIGPMHYLSIAMYSVSIALLLAPLALPILPYISPARPKEKSSQPAADAPRASTLRSLVEIVAIHGICAGLFALALSWISQGLTLVLAVVWPLVTRVVACVVVPWIGRHISTKKPDTSSWRAFSLLPIVAFLATFSLPNFSFCVVAAALVVPPALLFSVPRTPRALHVAALLLLSPEALLVGCSLLLRSTNSGGPLAILETLHGHFSAFSALLFPFALLVYAPMNLCHLRIALWKKQHMKEALLVFVFVAACSSSFAREVSVVDLSGGGWTVRNATSSFAATVPGCVHTDLRAAGAIGDPNFRDNDQAQLWVARCDWTYSRTFDAGEDILWSKRTLLVADGVDTFAQVRVNGQLVGASTSMFRRHVWDVPEGLLDGTGDRVEIAFRNAPAAADAAFGAHPYALPCSDNEAAQHGLPHRNFVRKQQCSFSWDWGPVTATQGIFRGIRLVGFTEGAITDVVPQISLSADGASWVVRTQVVMQGFHDASASLSVAIEGVGKSAPVVPVAFLADGELVKEVVLSVPKDSVELWWPNEVGPGTRKLYTLTASLSGVLGQDSKMARRIGFRRFELVQEPISGETGLSFYFRVNGVPVFSKGANFIPADNFESSVTNSTLSWLLGSMAAAHMNTVRVWGGGNYASDEFYDICDELGLMVWQEFMFACAMYPRTPEFLQDVRAEVTDQVRRLASHASLVMYGGNNENEAAFGWFPETTLNPKLYAVDYAELYINTIHDSLVSADASRPFIPSSPSNMALVDKPGLPYVMRWGDAQDTHYGDVHYYNYAADCWDVNTFPRPRFASEYGFQSLPSMPNLETVLLESDLSYTSDMLLHRQHHGNGQSEMLSQLKLHFFPANISASARRLFDDQCYLSQVVHAQCMKSETEHYRRIKSEKNGHCMGTLYWQLNDIWPAPTWASIEYGGRWKLVHNVMSNVFRNFLISPFIQNKKLGLYVVNDLDTTVSGTATIDFVLWKTGAIAVSFTQAFSVPAFEAQSIFSEELTKVLAGKAAAKDGVFVMRASDKQGNALGENVLYPTSLTEAALVHTAVHFNVARVSDTEADITVYSDAVAPFVFLQSASVIGRFDDNGFLLRPSVQKTIRFTGCSAFEIAAFTAGLTVRSLSDTY